jgi:hypothetical protein
MGEERRLVEGIAAGLAYDFCCFRGYLFNEAYLASSVGEILQSLHGGVSAQVTSGFQHPRLAKLKAKSGRKPEIDFVVAEYDDRSDTERARSANRPVRRERDANLIATAVETKWAGSSHCTVTNVIWDLLRLEMVKTDNADSMALLLIAGSTDSLSQLKNDGLDSVLSFSNGPFSISMLPKAGFPDRRLAEVFQLKKLQALDFPRKLNLVKIKAPSHVQNVLGFGVHAWRVESSGSATFKPADVAAYRFVENQKKGSKA